MSDSPDDPTTLRTVTLRRGLYVIGRGVRSEPTVFAIAVGGSAVYGAMTVGQAVVVGRVVEVVVLPALAQGRASTAALALGALAIVAAASLKGAGVLVRRYAGGVLRFRLGATYRRLVAGQYLRLPMAWHARHPTGRLLSTANADVDATWDVLSPLPMAVGVIVMLATALVALIATDLVLALIGLLVFPAVFGVNAVYRRVLSPLAADVQVQRAAVSARAHESFEGAAVVKTFGREAAETSAFETVSERLRDRQVQVGRVRGLFDPLMDSLPTLGVLAVLLVGARRVASGDLTPAELVQVAYLFTLLSFPVRAIGWVLSEMPRSVVGWDRLSEVLDADEQLSYGSQSMPGDRPPAVRVSGLTHRYAGAAAPVLDDVGFVVPAGSTTAIVGPTGGGKSTLAALLVRLFDPEAGRVTYDDTDVRELSAAALAGTAALVPQQAFLLADSVRANVTLGLTYDDESVWVALRRAQADGFVRALAGGLDSVLGEGGATLSGGQRQRLALARALVRNPAVLVLDDATSAVDPPVEAGILASLRGEVPSTLILIAHRRATIELADQVVLLAEGRVRDTGTHDELLARSAGYRALLTAYDRDEVHEQDDRGGGEELERRTPAPSTRPVVPGSRGA